MKTKNELIDELEATARELRNVHSVSVFGVVLDYTEDDLVDHICVMTEATETEPSVEHQYLDAVRALTMDVSNKLHTSQVGFLPATTR